MRTTIFFLFTVNVLISQIEEIPISTPDSNGQTIGNFFESDEEFEEEVIDNISVALVSEGLFIKECEHLETNHAKKNCSIEFFEKRFLKLFNFKQLKRKHHKNLRISFDYKINTDGQILLLKSYNYINDKKIDVAEVNNSIDFEISRTLKLMPIFKPALFNGNKIDSLGRFDSITSADK